MSGGCAALELVAPAHLWVPEHAVSSGGEVADLAACAGVVLDPEQRLVVDVWHAEGPHGWVALEHAVVAPRQNGKTVALQATALAALYLFDARLVVWTAHLFSTTQEAFRDLDGIIAGTPALAARVKRIDRANGEEGFELVGDRRLKFRARSRTGGRGLTADLVILDEAWALSAAELGSLLPTLSTRPNPRVVYASSAGLVDSVMLRALRDRGRAHDPTLTWVEWAAPDGECGETPCDHAPGTAGCLLDDEERWRSANPAVVRGRIKVEHLRAERRALPPDEFARERLGWWDEPAGPTGLPLDAWADCADRDAEITEPCVLGVDVTPGHGAASIVVCGGALHVVDHHRGTGWVASRVVELVEQHDVAAVGLDPSGPAGALLPDLEAQGLTVRSARDPHGLLVLIDGREMTQACGAFLAGMLEEDESRRLVHRDELVLNRAVEGAARRQAGDAWRWSRRDSSVDISPLVAATIARWLDSHDTTVVDLAANVW